MQDPPEPGLGEVVTAEKPAAARSARWHVLAAFVASRLVVAAALVFVSAGLNHDLGAGQLQGWDGGWYGHIADHGYSYTERVDEPSVDSDVVKTAYPYFPGLPALLRAGEAVGVPKGVTGVVASNVALVLSLWGVHVLARRRYPPRAAALSVWALALFPGSVALSMMYPESILVAASVWAFVAVDSAPTTRGRDLWAALAAVVAALMRPNGIVVAVALAVWTLGWGRGHGAMGRTDRGLRRTLVVAGPAFAVFAAWLAYLWVLSGDPLAFVTAKSQWHEVTIVETAVGFFTGARAGQWMDLVLAAAGAAFVLGRIRDLPGAWTLSWALFVLPSMVLGTVGLGRYTATSFVVAIAVGVTLTRWPKPAAAAVLALSTCGLGLTAVEIFASRWVP